VTFVVPADSDIVAMSVVGDFNGWTPSSNRFVKRGGTLRASLLLDANTRYAFRYVTQDGRWLDDDDADAREPNGFGGTNGVLNLFEVEPAGSGA